MHLMLIIIIEKGLEILKNMLHIFVWHKKINIMKFKCFWGLEIHFISNMIKI